MSIQLYIEPLTSTSFKPYGEVIEAGDGGDIINAGNAASFTDLANIDVADNGGQVSVNIYQATKRGFPFEVKMVERHPLGSQAFLPMHGQRFLTIVVEQSEPPQAKNLKAFISNGRQGINLAKGTWHHPFFAIDGGAFLVIDRKGIGENCQEFYFENDGVFVNEK